MTNSNTKSENFERLASFSDIFLLIGANIALHFLLTDADLKLIVLTLSSILVAGRIIITTKFNSYKSQTENKLELFQGNIYERSDSINRKLESMEKVIPLIQEQNRTLISNVNSAYLSICSPELRIMKNNILQDTLDALKQINSEEKKKILSHSSYYSLLFDSFEKTISDKEIYAVSFIKAEEWEDTPQEIRFWEETIKATNKGVKIHRIFVSTTADMNAHSTNEKIQKHFDKSFENLTGYFVNEETLKKNEPQLLEEAGSGFIVFDDDYAFTDKVEVGRLHGRRYSSNFIISNLKRVFHNLKTFNETQFEIPNKDEIKTEANKA